MVRIPTLKQKRVAKILSENLGKPLGEAMREAGYSESTSKTPANLTNSETWKNLLDSIKDEDVISTLNEGLLKSEYAVRIQYAREIAKLKDKYPATKNEITGKDGSAFQIEVLNHEVNVSGYFTPPTAPNTRNPERPQEIQDAGVAQTSEKDNNSTD